MPALKALVRQSVHAIGGMQVFRFLNQNGVRILMYHRFPADTKALDWQCNHIREHYLPISLELVAESLQSGRPLPANALVITIDDGYRDFFLYGYPAFRKFELPTMVYLVSDFVDGRIWLWWNQIEYAFQQTQRKAISLKVTGSGPLDFSFDTGEQRMAVARTVAESLTTVDDSERLGLLKLIPQLLEVEIPTSPPERWAALSWNEVRTLAQNGVDFGAHTKTHPILSRITDPGRQREEIEGSKIRLEQELGRPVRHFCYPNGSRPDFDDQTVDLVRQSGFLSATTTERGLNFPGSEPYLLHRIGVEPALPKNYFIELLAGARKR